jgi:anti-sigma factor RsiW
VIPASPSLDHARARELFAPLLDAELPAAEVQLLRRHLSDCPQCQQGFLRYERAVELLRDAKRARAPAGFAARVLQRVRKRRRNSVLGAQGARFFQHVSIPVEAAIPILLAAAVAAALLFAAP